MEIKLPPGNTSIDLQAAIDNAASGDIDDTCPDNVEILLLRDGEVYKRAIVNSTND